MWTVLMLVVALAIVISMIWIGTTYFGFLVPTLPGATPTQDTLIPPNLTDSQREAILNKPSSQAPAYQNMTNEQRQKMLSKPSTVPPLQ